MGDIMNCNTVCSNKKRSKCQEQGDGYPLSGSSINIPFTNYALEKLKPDSNNQDVYFYVMTTIKLNKNGQFIQTGTGPNFQGGLITLCTCKHLMRSSLEVSQWEDKWIAGFTSITCVNNEKKNYLVYLMKVSEAFESYNKLWSNNIPSETKKIKNAHTNRLGDIYKPIMKNAKLHDRKDYEKPCINHDRYENNEWHTDIKYNGYSNRPAALLVGNRKQSFLYEKPIFYFNTQLLTNNHNGIGSGYRKLKFEEFLKSLKR